MVPVTQLTTETDAHRPPTLTPPGEVVHAADSADAAWWRDAVIYQVYPRSWADADGDGIGDLPGITARLPYLRDLGVDAVWLSPFYVSPMNDAGYDVADYRDVDPRFGSLDDADAMVATAHDLGLKVLVDLVPNHTSSEHAWFRAALAAGPGSPERERYIFRDGRGPNGEEPPNNWPSVFGGRGWTRVTEADGTPGPVVPAHLRRHPARPELEPPRGGAPSSTASCGSGATGASTASGSTSPTAWSSARGCPTGTARSGSTTRSTPTPGPPARAATPSSCTPPTARCSTTPPPAPRRCGTRTACTRSTAAGAGCSTSYGLPDRILCAEAWVHAGPPRWRATCAPTRCTRRSTSTSSTPTGTPRRCAPSSRRRCAPTTTSGRRPPGCCPTTTSCGTPPGSGSTSRCRAPTASAPPTPSRMPCSACAARAPPRRSCSRCPAAPTSTRARSSGCPSTRRCPTRSARTRPSTARTARSPAATAAGCRCRGSRGRRATASARVTQPWLPQPDAYADLAVDQQEGVAGSTLELYRTLLEHRRVHRARSRQPHLGRPVVRHGHRAAQHRRRRRAHPAGRGQPRRRPGGAAARRGARRLGPAHRRRCRAHRHHGVGPAAGGLTCVPATSPTSTGRPRWAWPTGAARRSGRTWGSRTPWRRSAGPSRWATATSRPTCTRPATARSWPSTTPCSTGCPTARGAIATLPYEAVSEARIGGTEPIPLLSDLFEQFPDTRINIDIKADDALDPTVREVLRHNATDRVCIGSFSERRLRAARAALGPEVATAAGQVGTALLRFTPASLSRMLHTPAPVLQLPALHRLRGRTVTLVTPGLVQPRARPGQARARVVPRLVARGRRRDAPAARPRRRRHRHRPHRRAARRAGRTWSSSRPARLTDRRE